jgi:polysaccharide export outer membrane protein
MKQLIVALVGLVMAVLPAAAQDTYQIKVGDVLSIEVLEDTTLNRSVLVAPDGRITLPLAGSVKVSGESVDQVQADLTAKLAPNFAAKPTVYVGISSVAAAKAVGGTASAKTVNVYVIGQALKPGKYAIDRGTTILQFLAEIGGFTNYAATKRIQLHRVDASGKEVVYTLNYGAVEAGAADTLTGTVANGDVFIIPPRHLFE